MSLFKARLSAHGGVAMIPAVLSLLILGVLAVAFTVSAFTVPPISSDKSDTTASVHQRGWSYQWFADQDQSPHGSGADVTRDMENPACLLVLGCCNLSAYFWDLDVIQGPLHANTRIPLYNSPSFPFRGARFWGKVTSASDHFRCMGLDEGGGCPEGYATFYDGYELGVPAVNCDIDYSKAEHGADPLNGGLLLPLHETWITLNDDGTMWVYQPEGDPPYSDEPGGALACLPPSGVVGLGGTEEDGDIHLQGILNGRLTILAGRRIIVEGDIIYRTDPRMGLSTDRLGLLAGWKTPTQGHLVIPDVDPSGTDGDRQIFGNYIGPDCNASLLVQNYEYRHNEGVLTIYGSIFQGVLRPTQSIDGQHGYSIVMAVDPLGCASPPPRFPELEPEE